MALFLFDRPPFVRKYTSNNLRPPANARFNNMDLHAGTTAVTGVLRATILRVFQPSPHMEINPIKSEITALQARFDALRGYL